MKQTKCKTCDVPYGRHASFYCPKALEDKGHVWEATEVPEETVSKRFAIDQLLWPAFRYFLGRQTAIATSFPDLVREHFLSVMTEQDKAKWAQEIREYKAKFGRIGMAMDEKVWLKFALELAGETDTCPCCGGDLAPRLALQSTSVGEPDLGGDIATVSFGGPGRLIDCLKCLKCGWSVTV